MSHLHENIEAVKHTADIAAGGVALGSLLAWLPYWAAAFTIIWTGMRMWDWIWDKIEGNKNDED